jgi:maltose O-acetyltransferase
MNDDSERAKMLRGELYNAMDPELAAARAKARRLFQAFNASGEEEVERRRTLLRELFGVEEAPWIEPPFYCDYGVNIRLLGGAFFNFNCVVLDVCEVTIGDKFMAGPAVQIYTATHPLDAATRYSGREFGKPVVIGSEVWVGGGAIICPGVTIGDRAVIGAGSVVTRDIPSGVVAAGNPCRVLRTVA